MLQEKNTTTKPLNQNKMEKYKNNYGEEEDTSPGALFVFFLIIMVIVLGAMTCSFINL